MRPEQLKIPFRWEERCPAFFEGVLIVPKQYEAHSSWKYEGLFPLDSRICIEYCSGNGDWVIEKALKNPNVYWVAVEMEFERVRKIWSKMKNCSVPNLLIVCGEALTFTSFYLENFSVDQIFVNFPDPWPKRRHAKHRLVQGPFIEQIARVIKRGGSATFATDDQPYSEQIIYEMVKNTHWKCSFPKPYFVNTWENYGGSWFQNLWSEKGRQLYYMQYERL